MKQPETIHVSLPPPALAHLRAAVEAGEYASSNDAIRDAVQDWSERREQRARGLTELRALWQASLDHSDVSVSAPTVLDKLEKKYQALADNAGAHS